MRSLMAALLVVLAGCAGPAPADDMQGVEAFEPVHIQIREALYDGFPETEWAFEVGPGAEGHISFRLEPVHVRVGTTYCFKHDVVQWREHGPRSSAGATCPQSNLSGTASESPRVLFEADALPGTYWFSFSAGPGNVPEFVADVHVAYP